MTAGPRRLRVGLIGTGLIAQVMHLHYLTELAGQFEIAAVADIAPGSAEACADRYGIPGAYTDWRDLLRHPIDAVLVLTSGSHAPIAVAAAQAGLHVFTEKPMCFSVAEGREMVAAAERAGVVLMVGYPKRYDPAFARFADETARLTGTRMMRVTTFESPIPGYVGHYPLLPREAPPADLLARLRADSDARVTAAIGEGTELERAVYENVLLDTLVHELNTIRGVLGEPDRIDYVSLHTDTVTVMFRFGSMPVALHWIDLPGISRYEMEFACYAPQARVRLAFPSPFLRNEAAVVEMQGGDLASARSWRTEEVVSHESGFKAELAVFHECAVTGAVPPTSGLDGLRDIALCEAIIECHRAAGPGGRTFQDRLAKGDAVMGTGGIAVANAPVSYGAFEVTVGHDPNTPDGTSVLDQVAEAGYAGIDLGPVGYLGTGDRLGELLAERGLGLAGAYLELPYAEHGALEQVLPDLDALLDTFDTVRGYLPGPPPRPTLADAGSAERRGRPFRSARERSLGLDGDGWRLFAEGLARAVARCRDRGYEPTFHPESGTYVEAPWEIEQVLDRSDIGLCLETGHMMLGGGDPVALLRDWAERINHVHLKDASLAVRDGIVADGVQAAEIWSREAFPMLGAGDLDVDAVLDGLRGVGFGGWLVVEQDILPRSAERFAQAADDQRRNRAFLAARGV